VQLYRADAAKIDVAYPAVDARFAPASPAEVQRVRARYGLSERYVLHLGTVKPRKNLPRLIRAFSQARLPPDTQLVLGGMTTFGAGAVEQAIRDSGLGKRLLRLAYVPDGDLAPLYSGAAGVAIVSLYEGFGMPALEALACGAPLVVSNRGSLPEIVGDAALVVDPLRLDSIASGLNHLVLDGRSRDELRELGLRRAAHFDWGTAARVTREALEAAFRSDAGIPPRSRSRSAAS
jgi:glycosyltransferase involved in cell wall biosynthesis